MAVTDDDFRALARSSPWLWRTLQFTLTHDNPVYPVNPLRAFVSRPHGVRIERLDGRVVQTDWVIPGSFGMPTIEGAPILRADGLVARRPEPDDPRRYDDPMFQSYQWVAMLHPFELADGVADDDDGTWSPLRVPIEVVDRPREVDHHGRSAWQAQVITTSAYAARCSCCALLGGDEAHRRGVAEGWAMSDDNGDRPGAWTLRLDRGTGVLVALTEIGGAGHGRGWSMTIEAVDTDMPRSMFDRA